MINNFDITFPAAYSHYNKIAVIKAIRTLCSVGLNHIIQNGKRCKKLSLKLW